jgi:phosphate transport system protein
LTTGFTQAAVRTILPMARTFELDTIGGAASLAEIDRLVQELFALVSENLAAAIDAFLSGDRDAARALVAADQELDKLEAAVEQLINRQLTALPPPGSESVRMLVGLLRIVPELERSGDLVEHIALRTPQGMAAMLSPRARGLIQQMGDAGVHMWRAAAVAYTQRDATVAESLRAVDDQLDDLHVSLSAELGQCLTSVPVAIEMGLIARFLERLGDHAVNVTRRVQDLGGAAVVA